MSANLSVAKATVAASADQADPWAGIPESFKKDPSYYKHFVDSYKTWVLHVGPPKSGLSNSDVMLVTPEEVLLNAKKPDDQKRFQMRKITSPPMRVRYPSMHGTGDFTSPWNPKGITGQTLLNAHFSVIIYSGNIPDDLSAKFAAIKQEQINYFKFCDDLEKHVIGLMFDHPKLRVTGKQELKNLILDVLDGDEVAFAKPENQSRLRQKFFDGANKGEKGKTPYVRGTVDPETGEGRFQQLKKSVCGPQNPEKPRFANTGETKDGVPHYIDQYNQNKKDYNPPTLKDASGKEAYDLGRNEIPIVQSNDIWIASHYPKIYDAGSYGVRPLYCCLQRVRGAKPEERQSSAVDHSLLDGEEESFADILAQAKDRAAEYSKNSRVESSEYNDSDDVVASPKLQKEKKKEEDKKAEKKKAEKKKEEEKKAKKEEEKKAKKVKKEKQIEHDEEPAQGEAAQEPEQQQEEANEEETEPAVESTKRKASSKKKHHSKKHKKEESDAMEDAADDALE